MIYRRRFRDRSEFCVREKSSGSRFVWKRLPAFLHVILFCDDMLLMSRLKYFLSLSYKAPVHYAGISFQRALAKTAQGVYQNQVYFSFG